LKPLELTYEHGSTRLYFRHVICPFPLDDLAFEITSDTPALMSIVHKHFTPGLYECDPSDEFDKWAQSLGLDIQVGFVKYLFKCTDTDFKHELKDHTISEIWMRCLPRALLLLKLRWI